MDRSKFKKQEMIPDIPMFIIKYLMIGFVWLLIVDLYMAKGQMENGTRIRYFLLWPFTLGAFILGVINAISKDNDEDM